MAEPTTEVLDEEELEPRPDEEEERPQLDPERAARRQAAMRFVRQYGDPVLKTKALAVERFDDELRAQAERMAALMEDLIGVGLAAPQVGSLSRMLIYRVGSDAALAVIVNPEIEWRSKDEET